MQGTTIKLLTGGLLMVAAAGYVQAEALSLIRPGNKGP